MRKVDGGFGKKFVLGLFEKTRKHTDRHEMTSAVKVALKGGPSDLGTKIL